MHSDHLMIYIAMHLLYYTHCWLSCGEELSHSAILVWCMHKYCNVCVVTWVIFAIHCFLKAFSLYWTRQWRSSEDQCWTLFFLIWCHSSWGELRQTIYILPAKHLCKFMNGSFLIQLFFYIGCFLWFLIIYLFYLL